MTKSMKSVLTIAVVSGLAVGTFAIRTLAADRLINILLIAIVLARAFHQYL